MRQGTLDHLFGATKKAKVVDAAPIVTVAKPRDDKVLSEELEKSTLFPLLQDQGWREALMEEFTKPYFKKLEAYVESEYAAKTVFPPREVIFNALNTTPLHSVKVVILGQDPYFSPKQAMGLSFSVPPGVTLPSSLRNIFKEIKTEFPEWQQPPNGDLTEWAKRGALLLNTGLTVREGTANSHSGQGWEHFTDRVISVLAEQKQPIAFLLWGQHAQARAAKLKGTSHLILKSAHPSGLSASKGFFGNQHFVKANQFFLDRGVDPFDWNLKKQ